MPKSVIFERSARKHSRKTLYLIENYIKEMSIVSNAASDELDSPFFIENEKLCKKWEAYILEKGGKIKGLYNSWSFNLHSKVKSKNTWLIDIKKATYTSGNLLLSSKYQSLAETLTFTADFKETDCENFYIGKSLFKKKSRNHPFFEEVKDLIRIEQFKDSIYEVKFKDKRLTIVLHHQNDWFEMADRILAFEPEE